MYKYIEKWTVGKNEREYRKKKMTELEVLEKLIKQLKNQIV